MIQEICSLCGQKGQHNLTQVQGTVHSVMFHLCDRCVKEILEKLQVPPQKILNHQEIVSLNKKYHKTLERIRNKREKNSKKP